MKWLLLIPFRLEAEKIKPASSLNNLAVMFWSWEPLWRQLWNFHVFCSPLNEIECPDSSLPTGRRQVQNFPNFIIFDAYLIILLASMLYGHLEERQAKVLSTPLFCCISLCTNISVFKRWEKASLCIQRFPAIQPLISVSLSLSHPQSQLLSSTRK